MKRIVIILFLASTIPVSGAPRAPQAPPSPRKSNALSGLRAARAGKIDNDKLLDGADVPRPGGPGLVIIDEEPFQRTVRYSGRWRIRGGGHERDRDYYEPPRMVRITGMRQTVKVEDRRAFVRAGVVKGLVWGGGLGLIIGLLAGFLISPVLGAALFGAAFVGGGLMGHAAGTKAPNVFEREVVTGREEIRG